MHAGIPTFTIFSFETNNHPVKLPESVIIVSAQNGVSNAKLLQQYLPENTVVACVVGFNVVWQDKATFHRGDCYLSPRLCFASYHALGTNTPLILGALKISGNRRQKEIEEKLCGLLKDEAGLPTKICQDINRVQWTKLLMNLNNALDALSMYPIKKQLQYEAHRWTLAACQDEALRVLQSHGIQAEAVGLFIPQLMPHLLRLPNWLYKITSPLRITEQARGSMVISSV